MAVVSIILKIMPESPEVDLNEIRLNASKLMEIEGAMNISYEEKPIAFGLNAIFMKFAIDEAKGTDIIESKISAIKNVSSVTIEDYRRAFG